MEDVRPATPEDLPACATLLAQARREVATRRGGDLLLAAAGGDADVAEWAEEPGRLLLVGRFEGAVVGLASGHVASPGAGQPVGRVDCCYVEPAARRVGVGGALVAALVSWFRARECGHVDAVALPGDRDSKQLYETAGFKARLLVLHHPLR